MERRRGRSATNKQDTSEKKEVGEKEEGDGARQRRERDFVCLFPDKQERKLTHTTHRDDHDVT